MEWLDKVLRSRAKYQTEGYLGERGPAVSPNGAYLTVDVASLWITHVRKGLNKFYGAVHGSVVISHETGAKREFQAFNAIADAQELDAGKLDRIIQGPYRLLASVPYRGAGVNVRIALMSVKSADLVAPYIGLLKSVSDVAGVAFVAQAAPLVDVIHTGVSLLGGGDSIEIGRYGLFDPVYTGYYAVVRADPTELTLDKLGFDEQSRVLTVDNEPVTDYPYFVLKISASTERDYWYDIPDIKDAYNRMKNQFRESPDAVEPNLRAFDAFQVTAELSPDLLSNHAQKLVEDVRKRFSRFITEQRRSGLARMDSLDIPLESFRPFQ